MNRGLYCKYFMIIIIIIVLLIFILIKHSEQYEFIKSYKHYLFQRRTGMKIVIVPLWAAPRRLSIENLLPARNTKGLLDTRGSAYKIWNGGTVRGGSFLVSYFTIAHQWWTYSVLTKFPRAYYIVILMRCIYIRVPTVGDTY